MQQDQSLNLTFHERPADSSFVETIWQSRSGVGGTMLSVAATHWEMIVSHVAGNISVTVRGPETKPLPAPVPGNGEWLGIEFKLGVLMPHLPTVDLVDDAIELPEASGHSFWLRGSAWELPTFENAEVFVDRLVREEILVCDPLVESALQRERVGVTQRSVQRRFRHATGLTQSAVEQIQRARHATRLLQQGTPILDTVDLAGYYDQPHLTRSLRRLIGRTPNQLLAQADTMPLSFISNTE